MPELAFFRHGEELLRVVLADTTTIGRAPECDVALPDPGLSRLQASVEREGDRFVLRDRSGKGTRVGAETVTEATLSDGAEMTFGGWRALFRSSTSSEGDTTRVSEQTSVREPSPPQQGAARLRIRQNDRERVIDLVGGAITVGTADSSDIVLEDPFVSGQHARLEQRDSRWRLRDLGSTNGTYMAGVRITEADLPPGIPVAIGDAELLLELEPVRPLMVASDFEGLVSRDPGMHQLFELVERVAAADAAVTVLGETGTGKELVARALHRLSPRRDEAFIPVNCSAIAESLMESELFGHERGAFSGAERLRKGAFEEADGGTIFLDEIGELSLDLQPKLLRALELGEVKRVGASRPMTVDVRIVAATHRDLRAQVRAGRFREDLYYRLCVIPITLPPLRSRRSDIVPLAEHFLRRSAPRGAPVQFAKEALEKLEAYDWPGNVRQLRNVVQRALLFRNEGLVLPASAVILEDVRTGTRPPMDDGDTLYVRGLTLEEVEREVIRLSLRRNRGRRSAVVKELGIAKSTVLKRITEWNLHGEGRDPTVAVLEED